MVTNRAGKLQSIVVLAARALMFVLFYLSIIYLRFDKLIFI